ncbi:MAG: hypothetical protein V7765_06140 [Oleispira sp.]
MKNLHVLLVTLALIPIPVLAAPLIYDEESDGDLDRRVTYIGALDEGVNTITGSSGASSNPSEVDYDWPRVDLPSGLKITSVIVDITNIVDNGAHTSFGFNVSEYGERTLAKHVFHLNETGLSEDENTNRTIYLNGDVLLDNSFKLSYPLGGNKSYELSLVSFSGQRWDLNIDYKWIITVSPVFINTPPIISIISPQTGTSYPSNGSAIMLSAEANDHEDGNLENSVSWESDIDGSIISPAVLSEGIHILTASVEDSNGTASSDSTRITVSPVFINTPPTISILSPQTGTIFPSNGSGVTLSAEANDHDDGDLVNSVNWESDLDGSIISPAVLSEGTHTLTASVEDSHGAISSDSTIITVGAMQPFLLAILAFLFRARSSKSKS